ncbi:MAG TPA: hypothetical protein VFU38_03495 [Candidatus Krumholzibacteria bacterium]|nr:hypothetical protein [Candidatus Krumholzibacteria bacterium]
MMKTTFTRWGLVFAALCACSACSKKSETNATRTLTPAQRDSAIAASKLPGAQTVGKALEVADSAKARASQPIPEP